MTQVHPVLRTTTVSNAIEGTQDGASRHTENLWDFAPSAFGLGHSMVKLTQTISPTLGIDVHTFRHMQR